MFGSWPCCCCGSLGSACGREPPPHSPPTPLSAPNFPLPAPGALPGIPPSPLRPGVPGAAPCPPGAPLAGQDVDALLVVGSLTERASSDAGVVASAAPLDAAPARADGTAGPNATGGDAATFCMARLWSQALSRRKQRRRRSLCRPAVIRPSWTAGLLQTTLAAGASYQVPTSGSARHCCKDATDCSGNRHGAVREGAWQGCAPQTSL